MKIFFILVALFMLYPLLMIRCATRESEPCSHRDVGFNQGQRCD